MTTVPACWEAVSAGSDSAGGFDQLEDLPAGETMQALSQSFSSPPAPRVIEKAIEFTSELLIKHVHDYSVLRWTERL